MATGREKEYERKRERDRGEDVEEERRRQELDKRKLCVGKRADNDTDSHIKQFMEILISIK